MLVTIEKEVVVAAALVTDICDDISGFFPLQLRFFLSVWHQVQDVTHQGSKGCADTA